jgi:hypothetical protein
MKQALRALIQDETRNVGASVVTYDVEIEVPARNFAEGRGRR